MFFKKRSVKWTVVFFTVIVICTFASKTIYYFSLPKVSVEKPKGGSFSETATLTQGTLGIKDAASYSLDLPTAITVEEVFVAKGDMIEAGDEILRFGTDDVEKQIVLLDKQRESAEIALSEFRRAFDSRVTTLKSMIPDGMGKDSVGVTGETAGLITALDVSLGGRVAAGSRLCAISDNSRLIVKLPFSSGYTITVGMKAEVSVPSAMTTVSGTVSEVGGLITLYGSEARMVTIAVTNTSSLTAGTDVSAVLDGGLTPMSYGSFEYPTTTAVYAPTGGSVSALNISLGESVPAGKLLMTIALSDTDSTKTAKDELDYLLSTGIYNGRTEKQLKETLDGILENIAVLTALSENGTVTAPENGFITTLSAQKDMKFAGGTLFTYASEKVRYQVTFTGGSLSSAKLDALCSISYYLDGRENKASGNVAKIGIGNVTVTSSQLTADAAQATQFTGTVTLSSSDAAMTLPKSAMVYSKYVYLLKTQPSVLGMQYIATLCEVGTGAEDDYRVEITSGITKEDKVIVAWDRALSDGAVVDVLGQMP